MINVWCSSCKTTYAYGGVLFTPASCPGCGAGWPGITKTRKLAEARAGIAQEKAKAQATVPRPSSIDLVAAATAIAQYIHNEKQHDELNKCWGEVRLRRVIEWLDDQAELASDAEIEAQRRSGRGPDGEREHTPRDADND